MEMRVWVDGTQRVVCGVKLTTTCQEIVFALAHATQQAGRFTMIEKWRHIERLMKPDEQPLYTLQMWGAKMHEVEYILRRTSTDQSINQLQVQQHQQQQQQSQQQQQATLMRANHDNEAIQQQQQQQVVNGNSNGINSNPNISTSTTTTPNGIRESPSNLAQKLSQPTANHTQLLNGQSFDNVYQHHQYNLNRRPQTVLGQLTGSNSSIGFGPNDTYMTNNQSMARLSNSFRPTMSASTLPNASNNSITASPAQNAATNSIMRPHYADDQLMNTNNAAPIMRLPNNGYQIHSETQVQQQNQQQQQLNNQQTQAEQVSKTYPYEDLYSTINKKRSNQPPAVPAKPRVIPPIAPVSNLSMPHRQHLQPVNAAQMNYYHSNQSPLNMYASNLRPRHPPGYLDYIEAMANRNSLAHSMVTNPTFAQHSQHAQSNILQRSFDPHQQQLQQHMYNLNGQQNGSSPVNSMTGANNKYRYSTGSQLSRLNHDQNRDFGSAASIQNVDPIRPTLGIESGLVINRGSAVNVKLTPNSQSVVSRPDTTLERHDNSLLNNFNTCPSVSQMGHDMLKVIEEQKKVLMNQKNELERLDNDREYWDTKQNTAQAELINHIESEIVQLEELWKENQAQIQKLEKQDFERELQELKSEQKKMENEISKQRGELSRCERDIIVCKNKIEQLEAELAIHESDSDDTSSSSSIGERDELYMNVVQPNMSRDQVKSTESESFKSAHLGMHTDNIDDQSKEAKSSEDDDYEDDSGGDASDDLNVPISDNKHRSAKDVAYVDKRGLINGIRSLKLDKSRALNRQLETMRSTESVTTSLATTSINSKEKTSINNNIIEKRCPETIGQYPQKTANNNKYEFPMTL